jgi:hypothetical protein
MKSSGSQISPLVWLESKRYADEISVNVTWGLLRRPGTESRCGAIVRRDALSAFKKNVKVFPRASRIPSTGQ